MFENIVKLYFESSHSAKKSMKQIVLNEILPTNLKFIESKLERSPSGYLVGDWFTLADIFLVFILDWFKHTELIAILNDYPSVRRHYSLIKTIPQLSETIKNVRPNPDILKSLKNKKDVSFDKPDSNRK